MTISVIIPTLNEEKFIKECLHTVLQGNTGNIKEVIIIDAGSTDNTRQMVAEVKQVRWISAPELQGKKYASLNRGAALASGDILLFLDADTLLPANFDQLIIHSVSETKIGGAFELRFDNEPLSLRLIRMLNQVRYRLTHRFFGDQAIFCFRSIFEEIGRYPEKTVMEAAHFCDQMKKRGKLVLIKSPVVTSGRRFLRAGILKTFLIDFRIVVLDWLGYSNSELGNKYWSSSSNELK